MQTEYKNLSLTIPSQLQYGSSFIQNVQLTLLFFKKIGRLIIVCLIGKVAVAHAASYSGMLPSSVTQYACQSCHTLDSERTAPSFQAIAERYHTMPQGKQILMQKIRQGSVGAWGNAQMPPQVMVPDEELGKLADWVLQQKSLAKSK